MIGAFLARRTGAILFVLIALAIGGVLSGLSLPVGLFPQTSFPRVVVDLNAAPQPASQTALQITRPVEMAIRAIPGVLDVRSDTTRGSSQIAIDFGWGHDMVASTLLVDAAIAQTLPSLPAGVSYDVRRMDPTVFPIISYALLPPKPDQASQTALRDTTLYQIAPMLSGITGVSRVDVQGGDTAEIEVTADPRRLAAAKLGLNDLATALSGRNVLQAVGMLQDHHRLYLVETDNNLNQIHDIANTVLHSGPDGVLRLKDVATVAQGVVPQWMRVVEDGKPAILFNVYEQPDGNAVQIARQVQKALSRFPLPKDVALKNWHDQSELVTQSAGSVQDAILVGLGLAALVIILFLRNWRATLIAFIAVPVTMACTVLVLSLCGMSFNIMTLGGFAAAVGLLIDDEIVMIEHIAHRVSRDPAIPVEVAAREFLAPLTGSSLATLIVFLPLSFLSGVTGAFSKALSLTMAAALVISYVVTYAAVPILLKRFMNFRTWKDPDADRRGWMARAHASALDAGLSRPWLIGLGIVPILIAGWFAYQAVPTGFMPAVDEGGFVMDYRTKPGTSLIETEREIGQIDALIKADPNVETFSRRLGTGLGGDLGQSYHGDYFVRLKANHKRSTPAVMNAVMNRIEETVPGVEVELAQLMEDLIGDLTAVPQPIEIKLYSADPTALNPLATKIAGSISAIPGVIEVKSGVEIAGDTMKIVVDPVRAAVEGIDIATITTAVSTALTGTVATQIPTMNDMLGVRVRMPGAMAMRQQQLAELPIRAPDGHIFPLNRVAVITPVAGEAQISHDNLQPMVAVTGRIEGRGMGAAVADVMTMLNKPGMLPPGVRYELGGLYKQQQIAFMALAKVFTAALIAEFVLLMIIYGSAILSVLVITCSLLSASAVFIGLWIAGVDLNITALMGMTMVIGIGTEMAIFYVSDYVELTKHQPARIALREASRNRFRPIVMTTLAAILTLLPLAFAVGRGSEIQQPLAIAIVSGLLLEFPLVLLALPVMISLFTRRAEAH